MNATILMRSLLLAVLLSRSIELGLAIISCPSKTRCTLSARPTADAKKEMEAALRSWAQFVENRHLEIFTTEEDVGSCRSGVLVQCEGGQDGLGSISDSRNSARCDSTRLDYFSDETAETGTGGIPQAKSDCPKLDASKCGKRKVPCDAAVEAGPDYITLDEGTNRERAVPNVHKHNCNRTICTGSTWELATTNCKPRKICKLGSLYQQCTPAWDYTHCEWTGSECEPKSFREAYHFTISDEAHAEDQFQVSDHCAAYHLSKGTTAHPAFDKVVCATKDLASEFSFEAFGGQGSWKSRHREWMFQYYGDQTTGLALFLPGREKSCEKTYSYDPRLRPWYSSAASGPKDVVIIIDRSGSMSQGPRMVNARAAAHAVVKTLTWADRATVVAFSDKARTLAEGELFVADTQGRERLDKFIDSISPGGMTNYEQAFETAFELIKRSRTEARLRGADDGSPPQAVGAACKRTTVMLFLTDGKVTKGATGEELLGLIDGWNSEFDEWTESPVDVRIFTYALGDDMDDEDEEGKISTEVKDIACRNKGLYHAISDSESDKLNTVMANYYTYYAHGLAHNGHIVRYSEMYGDASTGDWMFTGAVPVYDRTVEPPEFFGVVAADILAAPMKSSCDFEYESCTQNLIAAMKCYPIELSEEQIEKLRQKTEKEGFGGKLKATCTGWATDGSGFGKGWVEASYQKGVGVTREVAESLEEGDALAAGLLGGGAMLVVCCCLWATISRKRNAEWSKTNAYPS